MRDVLTYDEGHGRRRGPRELAHFAGSDCGSRALSPSARNNKQATLPVIIAALPRAEAKRKGALGRDNPRNTPTLAGGRP